MIIKVIILPDVHLDTKVPKEYQVVKKFITKFKPDKILILGDYLDVSSLSAWDMDKKRKMEGRRYQKEIEVANNELDFLQANSKEVIFMAGNHEFRVDRYIDKNPEMEGMIDIPIVLNLDKRKIKYIPFNKIYKLGKCNFVHGLFTNQYHAAKHLEAIGDNIVYGHCFDEKTEILTNKGWKKGLELKDKSDISVATYNLNSKKIEYNLINKYYEYDNYKELIEIKSKHLDLLVTDEHGLVIEKSNGKQELMPAKNLLGLKNKFWKIPHAGNEPVPSNYNEYPANLQRLLINICADGSFENNSLVRFHLKKDRKINHLLELLNNLNIPFSYNKDKFNKVKINFNFNIPYYFENSKKQLNKWLFYFNPEIVLNEYSITDGHKYGNSVQIYTNKKQEIDLLQSYFIKYGYKANYSERNGNYTLHVSKKIASNINFDKVKKVKYNGKVWCVNVDNGTLVVRRNGKVQITQNTHRPMTWFKASKLQRPIMAYGLGCLCNKEPEYMQDKWANWLTQFAVMHLDEKTGKFNLYPVNIIDNKFIWDGVEYK